MDILQKIVWFGLFCSFSLIILNWEQDYLKARKLPTNNSALELTSTVDQINLARTIPDQYKVTFKTDIFEGIIDTRGGHLVKLVLLKYPQNLKNQAQPVVLLNHTHDHYYTADTGIATVQDNLFVKEDSIYRSDFQHYNLSPEQQELRIPLYTEHNGISCVKEFILNIHSYQVNVNYKIVNHSSVPWKGQIYAELNKYHVPESKGWFNISPYKGWAISSNQKSYEKISFAQAHQKQISQKGKARWLACIEPYFASAWISKLPSATYYASQKDHLYTAGFISAPWPVAPRKEAHFQLALYAGPKITEQLAAAAKYLDSIVDYGIVWFIAIGLLWILKKLHQVVGNWGWAIVLLTALIRLVFYRISSKGFRSMIKRSTLVSQESILKERYNNPLLFANARRALYRREGVSTASEIGSSLIQLPISYSLYWLLSTTIELRQEPFIFWMHDLLAPDPYYVLPLLMGLFIFFESSLNAAPRNTVIQERLALLQPVFYVIIFLNFPAGVVLYWVTNTLLSTLEKLWILRGSPIRRTLAHYKK